MLQATLLQHTARYGRRAACSRELVCAVRQDQCRSDLVIRRSLSSWLLLWPLIWPQVSLHRRGDLMYMRWGLLRYAGSACDGLQLWAWGAS